MNSISQMPSLRSLSNSFASLAQSSLLLFRSVLAILHGVPRRHSQHLKTEEEFLSKSLPVLLRIRGFSLCLSPSVCRKVKPFISFLLSYRWVMIKDFSRYFLRSPFHELFSFRFSEGHHFRRLIRSQLSASLSNLLN